MRVPFAKRPHWLDAPWTSAPRLGLGLIGLSCLISVIVGALGPSTVALNVGPATGVLPPWFVPVDVGVPLGLPPGEWVVVPAVWLGIIVGAIGLVIATRAVAAGWRPQISRLFGLGLGLNLATIAVLPLTSADVLMYAAYGRLQRLGLSPYDITPADVFRQAYDPVLVWTERPWQDTPSVYGPLVSGSQLLANWLGGDSMHDIVFWLQLFGMAAFVAIGAIVVRMAAGDPERQTRAVLFTVCNPLLIWSVVAGAHNEALCAVFAVGALALMRRTPFGAGVLLGLAGTAKASLVFYGIAMAWGYRREPRKLFAMAAGALIPLVVAYGVLAPQALLAAVRNTGYVSPGSWALPLAGVVQLAIGWDSALWLVAKLGWVLLVPIAWMLSRVIGWDPVPGARLPARDDPQTIATRTALVLSAAWVITSTWSMPWYDLLAWAPLALVASNRLFGILTVRGAVLSVGYVTARSASFGPVMDAVSFWLRDVAGAVVAFGVLALIVAWWSAEGRELPTRDFVERGWMRLASAWRRPGWSAGGRQ